jgi:sn-glycerol 3-phosphate transport system permease protein
MKTKIKFGTVSLHGIMLILVVINIFPIFWMISSAFKFPHELFTTNIHLIPDNPTLENFRITLFEYDFVNWFYNSVVTTLGISVLQVVIAVLAAFAMCYFKTKYNELIFYFLIATMVIPFQVTMIPNYILMSKMKLLNTHMAVILPPLANATTFFFIRQHFRSVPMALYEAATVEGAGHFWILRRVVVPLCKGSISASFILCVIEGWNQYFWPLLVLTKSKMRTLTVGLQQFLDFEMGNRWGPFMATATMASLPIIIVYLFIQKNIIEAFVHSGVKG